MKTNFVAIGRHQVNLSLSREEGAISPPLGDGLLTARAQDPRAQAGLARVEVRACRLPKKRERSEDSPCRTSTETGWEPHDHAPRNSNPTSEDLRLRGRSPSRRLASVRPDACAPGRSRRSRLGRRSDSGRRSGFGRSRLGLWRRANPPIGGRARTVTNVRLSGSCLQCSRSVAAF